MQQVDFERDKIHRIILKTSVPMLVAELLSLLYSIVDRIYIGRLTVGEVSALSGIGLCFPIIILTTGFANLYGMGGAPLMSMALGRREPEKAGVYLNTSLRLIVITSLIMTLLGEIMAEPLLRLFGADADTMPMALPYLRIYLLGTMASMLASGLNPYINAQGYPNVGMLSIAAGTMLNLILDPIFIFAMGMHVRGAAIATVLSQMVSAGIAVSFLALGQSQLKLEKPIPGQPFLSRAGEIISLGTASFIMACTNSFVTIACNSVLSHFGGSIYVSVMTVISSIRQILDTPVMALTNGASPLMSFSYGSRNPGRIRRTIIIITVVTVAYTALVWLCILAFPGMFVSIFTNDANLANLAVPALNIYFFAFVFQALQYCGQSVFKALNKKKQAIFFSLLRKAILVIPLTYLLPYCFGTGTDGVFLAEPISNVVGGLACFATMLVLTGKELKTME